jgi:hypothetical protein
LNADPERNAFGLEMGQRLDLRYTCTYNPVNVYLNGVYLGNYILTEHRQADPAGIGAPGRPRIHPTDGWFVEIDRLFPRDEPLKFLTTSYDLPVTIKSPADVDDINSPRYDFVKRDLNELADSMASDNFPENGYRDLIDLETFAKYFLVQTFIQNVDLFRTDRVTIDSTRARRSTSVTIDHIGSAFFYKGADGKIGAGPLWDLNWSFQTWDAQSPDGVRFGRMGPTVYPYMTHSWLRRFFDDPAFLVRYKEIWHEYYDEISSMRPFIDDICDRVYGRNVTWQRGIMTTFFNARVPFLNTEYNRVNVRPLARDLGTRGYNYVGASPRTVTLVSYGEMTGLSASLQKGALSEFEIVSGPTQTATGKGGYLATINIKPKDALAIATYGDTLILSGVKQGNAFSFRVPLTFTVSNESEQVSVLSYDRTVPQGTQTDGNAVVFAPPPRPFANFTAGPNPANRDGGTINFFWNGKQLRNGTLTVFDASGNAVNRASISDNAGITSNAQRIVASWDLTTRRGRKVVEGTYLVRGVITTVDGKRERITLVVGVR